MPLKRLVRITVFVFLNLGLIMVIPVLYYYIDDECPYCASLISSDSKEIAMKNKTLVNSYKIIETEFEQDELKEKFMYVHFWNERINMVKRDGSVVLDDTLFLWPYIFNPDEIKFKLFDDNEYKDVKENAGYWDLENRYRDTMIVGVYLKEVVVLGEFIYVKQAAN